MASDKKPSMYSDRGTIGSAEELEAYGVWVKSEPQDFTASLAEAANFNADALPYDAAFDTGFDSMGMGTGGFDLLEPELNIPEVSVEDDELDRDRGGEEASSRLLTKIAGELSTIRSELNTLKREFAEIRAESGGGGETGSTDLFSGEDDEKIALSGDEMESFFNAADFPAGEEMGFDPGREADEAALKELEAQNETEDIPIDDLPIDYENLGIALDGAEAAAETEAPQEELPPLEPAVDNDDFEMPSFDALSFDETPDEAPPSELDELEASADGFAEELVPLEGEDAELRELRLEGAESLAEPPDNADYLEEDPFALNNADLEGSELEPSDLSESALSEELVEEPALEDIAIEEPALEEPVLEDIAIEEPALEEPALEDIAIEEPALEEPVLEDIAIEEPALEEPALEDIAIEEPALEEPVLEDIAIEEPALEEPVLEDIAIEEPVLEEPVLEDIAIEEPALEEPVLEDIAIEEPALEEPALEDIAIEEPALEEPALEDIAIEEPVLEEPALEDIAIEEPALEEPALEDIEAAQPETAAASETTDITFDELSFDESSFDLGLDDFSAEPAPEPAPVEEEVVEEKTDEEPVFDTGALELPEEEAVEEELDIGADEPLPDIESLDLSDAVIDEPNLSEEIVEPPLEEPVLGDISFEDDLSLEMDGFETELEPNADEPAAAPEIDTPTDDLGSIDLGTDLELAAQAEDQTLGEDAALDLDEDIVLDALTADQIDDLGTAEPGEDAALDAAADDLGAIDLGTLEPGEDAALDAAADDLGAIDLGTLEPGEDAALDAAADDLGAIDLGTLEPGEDSALEAQADDQIDDLGTVDLGEDIALDTQIDDLGTVDFGTDLEPEPKDTGKAAAPANGIISDVDDSVIPEGFEVNAKEADPSLDDDLEAFADGELAIAEDESPSAGADKLADDGGEFSAIPAGLKNELKNVLSYMDHLLESLPEEKIEEFAQSEYFDKYKKIFKELGLV